MWTQNRTNIITRALKICKAVGEDQNASASQLSNGVDAINSVLEEWNNDGFSRLQMSLETISAPAGITITMNTATIGDDLTKDILAVYITDSGSDQPFLELIDYNEYYSISDKDTSTGEPYQAYIDYQDIIEINLYPALADTTTVNILRIKNIDSLDLASETPGVYKSYYNALTFAVADKLAYIYVNETTRAQWIKMEAERLFKRARSSEIKSQIQNMTKGAY